MRQEIIIYDSYRLPLQVELLFYLPADILGDTRNRGGLVDGTLQDPSMLQLAYPVLLRQVVQVMYGQHKAAALPALALQLLLGGGVPHVNRRQSFPEKLMIFASDIGRFHQGAKVPGIARRQQEMKPQRIVRHT